MTPTLLHATLLEAENFPENPWTSLRFLTSSGELLTRKLLEKLQKTLPNNCTVLNLYGSTEVAADATYAELPRDDVAIEHPLVPWVPCGRAIPNVWLEIRHGEEGDYAECTAGEEGEVFIFGACLSSGGFYKKFQNFLCLKIVYTSFMATLTGNILIQHQHFTQISSNSKGGFFDDLGSEAKFFISVVLFTHH